MSKALRIATEVVGIAALAVVTAGAGAALAAGATLSTSLAAGAFALGISPALLGTLAIAGAANLARKVGAKSPAVSTTTVARLNASLVPTTDRKICFGRSAMATEWRL